MFIVRISYADVFLPHFKLSGLLFDVLFVPFSTYFGMLDFFSYPIFKKVYILVF